MQTGSVNLQSTFDYPRARPGQEGESGETFSGVPEYKPTDDPRIYLSSNRRWARSARRTLGPVGRGAGFSRFPPLAAGGGESRTAGGPCTNRTSNSLKIIEVFHVDRRRKTARNATRSQLTYQHSPRQPEGLCRRRRTSKGRNAQALLPGRIAEARQLPRRSRRGASPERRP